MQGATPLVVFMGITNADFYVSTILDDALLPFIHKTFQTREHWFMQAKHVFHRAKVFMEENGIHWLHTPAESPDLNPVYGMS